MTKLIALFTILSLSSLNIAGQTNNDKNVQETERIVPIRFGDMESWVERHIKESRLLGGKQKVLYACGPTETIHGNKAYDFSSKTIWGISNAFASIVGIDKGACTTQPEYRDKKNGNCARLDTRMENVKVFGMIDLEVAIAGTLFLGSVNEPVKDINYPYECINMGIPFTNKPKALLLDLKARVSQCGLVTKATGFSTEVIKGHDQPEIYIYLQKRWEDKKGNIYAKRIGTARHRFPTSIPNWINDYRVDIQYGDITSNADFHKYMGLFPDGGQFKAINSEGDMELINEIGWGDPSDEPTHIILMITAGSYPAFYGTIGNAFWIDNLRFVY